ncbi:MAG TPA: protein kinase [Ktedonobacteraceae bacterium]|nr:protein kinase [Ktedonobacteraceae bacterium]
MQIEVLGERYQLQDPIGRGGMATIYRGRDMRMERVVAIKVLREVYSTDPKFVTRFQREAKAASVLQHPNIVQVYDYGQTDGNYFIVMELIEGTDLRRYLRSRGILAVDRAIIIAHDVALGLGAAHRRGIVHRDVKPQNVLVGRDGTIKLTDFGIASVYKDINAERLTTTGMTLGTVQYYAPEQAQGEIVSPAADVYALGIVMYEMLTGRPPFDGDTPVAVAMQHIQDVPIPPSQYNPNIPPALEDIIMRCLEKIPEMRYRDGSILARALESLSETEMGDLPTSLPGMPQTPENLPTYVQPANNVIPGRPQRPPVSSPNSMGGVAPHNQAGQFGQVGRSSPDNGTYNPEPLMLPNPQPYNNPIESSATRPYEQRGTTPRSGAVERHDSRVAGIVTAIILCATLLLLGFSLFLAVNLGYIHIPGLNNTTPSPVVPGLPVPNLIGLSYQNALTAATNAGFKLQTSGTTSGVVTKQSPPNGTNAASGSTIVVEFGPAPKKTVIVPNGLLGIPVTEAESMLTSAGIPYTLVHTHITDPTKPQNYVAQVSPPSGQSIAVGSPVQLYVGNDTSVTPTVTPGVTPTPSPTTKPSPSPTPSPTPSPSPSPSPTPKATKTPRAS